jgi:hypothetical protein
LGWRLNLSIDKHIADALQNIGSDRDITRELLDDVMRYLSKNEENHKMVGSIAAKYVETLQRSNEQLVKVISILQRQQSAGAELSDVDKTEIFEMLQEEQASEES